MILGLLLALLCLLPSPLHAAWAEVGTCPGGAGCQRNSIATGATVDSQNLSFPNNGTSGNAIVALGVAYDSGGAPASVSVTSTCSAALSVYSSSTVSLKREFIAFGPRTSGGACTVTVNPAGSNAFVSFAINEYSGGGTLDVDNAAGSSGSSTAMSVNITTTVPGALILGVASTSSSTTVDPAAGYTEIGEEEDNSTHQDFNALFAIAGAAGLYTVAWDTGFLPGWSAHVLSLAPTATTSVARRRIINP